MSYTYKYPRPMVTVDMMLIRFRGGELEALFIRRDRPPFQGKWAFPGGFVEIEEPLEQAARRELQEETGLSNIPLHQLWIAGNPGRDPRGRTISILFAGLLAPPFPEVRAGDDAREANWFSLSKLPPLAFDHPQLLAQGMDLLQERCLWRLWALLLLEPHFSPLQLEALGEVLWNTNRFTHKILQVAEQLGWITSEANGRYQRRASPAEIMNASVPVLLKAWTKQH